MNTAQRLDLLAKDGVDWQLVETAFAVLASPDPDNRFPGSTYAPQILVLVRLLAARPSTVPELVSATQAQRTATWSRLKRLRSLDLAVQDEQHRWFLTPDGETFRDLIDKKGVT